jgi:hypothetical protein
MTLSMASEGCPGNPTRGQRHCDNSRDGHGQNTYILDALAFSTSREHSDCGNTTESHREAECLVIGAGRDPCDLHLRGFYYSREFSGAQLNFISETKITHMH